MSQEESAGLFDAKWERGDQEGKDGRGAGEGNRSPPAKQKRTA